jgi:two-component system, chemotaxis family, sensor histidine kinase and response regulator WspE
MLALLQSPAASASASTSSYQPPVGPKILYAEDEPSVRDLSIRALAREGYSVIGAADGEEAWDTLRSEPFDLLVTDNNLPRMTGLDLVAKARAAGIHIPVILASS